MIRTLQRSSAALIVAAIAIAACSPSLAAAVSADHLEVELVSERVAVVPGEQAWLGVRLRHAPHWHSYWINPGDSGLPTTLTWTLPAGYRAADIAWPAPTRFVVSGLHNFGYDGDMLLPVAVEVPADAAVGDHAAFAVEAKWLICREECIPGKATLRLTLPIVQRDANASVDAVRFVAARHAWPQVAAWTATARLAGDRVAITLRGAALPDPRSLDAFAVQRRVLDNAPPIFHREGNALFIDAAKSDYFAESPATLDLVLTNGSADAWQVRVAFDPVPSASTRSPSP